MNLEELNKRNFRRQDGSGKIQNVEFTTEQCKIIDDLIKVSFFLGVVITGLVALIIFK